ncbi:MAG: hypothetical protein ACJAZN_001795 [Planctomycetota bacterium]|jgi:hypothetical protein
MIPFQNAFRLGVAAATIVAVAACSGGEAEHSEAGHAEEGHTHEALFGGTLVPLGDHFANIELTHDGETGAVKLFTMDAHATTSERSTTEAPVLTVTPHGAEEGFAITLAPRVSLQSGETVGDSSLFTGQSDSLKGLDHFMVKLSEITIKGETFKDVEFLHPADAHDEAEGEDHDEADHDHDEEGHEHDEEGHEHDDDEDHESSDG